MSTALVVRCLHIVMVGSPQPGELSLEAVHLLAELANGCVALLELAEEFPLRLIQFIAKRPVLFFLLAQVIGQLVIADKVVFGKLSIIAGELGHALFEVVGMVVVIAVGKDLIAGLNCQSRLRGPGP